MKLLRVLRYQSVMATQCFAISSSKVSPVERLAWSAIQFCCYSIKFFLGVQGQVGAFREVLPEQPVSVLVGAALPR